MTSGFQCAACGEWNDTSIDASAGSKQSYVEDCRVCCRPNLLRIWWDPQLADFIMSAELEYE